MTAPMDLVTDYITPDNTEGIGSPSATVDEEFRYILVLVNECVGILYSCMTKLQWLRLR